MEEGKGGEREGNSRWWENVKARAVWSDNRGQGCRGVKKVDLKSQKRQVRCRG